MIKSINCRGKLLTFETPLVMGIINLNDDSFYASSRATFSQDILRKSSEMVENGASIIDIGAMSSKPGSKISSPDDELEMVLPALDSILTKFPDAIVSVDTIHAKVASEAIAAGAAIINDISAGNFDPDMMSVVAKNQAPYIMMHMKGLPSDMQINPHYEDVVKEILTHLIHRIKAAKDAGVNDVVIDPGFGFGKTVAHNYELIRHMEVFQIPDVPVLAGISRKSMIWKPLHTDANGALNGTTALNMYLLQKGVNILRVHDVKEAVECVKIHQLISGVMPVF